MTRLGWSRSCFATSSADEPETSIQVFEKSGRARGRTAGEQPAEVEFSVDAARLPARL